MSAALSVLLIEDDAQTAELVANALRPWGDALRVFDSATATTRVGEVADVALIDLEIARGAGLALVHFFRAQDPQLPIVALIPPGDIETDMVAHSLGVNATVPKPLTGDALLVSLTQIRERKAARTAASKRPSTVPLRGVLEAQDPRALAESLARTAAELTQGAARVVLDDAREGEIVATAGGGDVTSAMDEALPLVAYDESIGAVHVSSTAPKLVDGSKRRALEQLVLTAATVGVLLRRVESIAHVGIKDPETSAYTFAYFVDVAGREIERARRYDRRFGLLTFIVENYTDLRTTATPQALREARRELVDTLLDAVRDSDVLAHVEDDELYLLLPETGMLGALAVRRRIAERHGRRVELARLEGRKSTELTIGISTFPRDGRDLASLLKAAHNRGNATRGSIAATTLRNLPGGLEAMLGALLRYRPDDTGQWQIRQAALSGDVVFALAHAIAREASRGEAMRDGVLYIVGDRAHPLVRGAFEAARVSTGGGAPAYWLRPRSDERGESSAQGVRLTPVEIEIDGMRVGPFVLLVALTESWAYACVASDGNEYMRALHTSDLELVEALVAELQTTFHLQRGIE